MDGFLLVDKPTGLSSQNVLEQIKRRFQLKKAGLKIGHGGTLDPAASGLLVVAIGKATRCLKYFLGSDKRYLAELCFGLQTDSDDVEGRAVARAPFDHIGEEEIRRAIVQFEGEIQQRPPKFSALHVQGKRAYALARAGQDFEVQARTVKIKTISLLSSELPQGPKLRLDIQCSAGTYIRALARDLGLSLGSVAYLSGLRRIASCHFDIREAIALEQCLAADKLDDLILPIHRAFEHFPVHSLDLKEERRLSLGQPFTLPLVEGCYRLCSTEGLLLAIFEKSEHNEKILRLIDR